MIHCALISLLATFSTHSLTITVSGVSSEKGHLRIGLYNNAAHFLNEDSIYKAAVIPAERKPPYSYTFKDLPPGAYSIAIYHDENDDAKCNKNWMGVPKEAYGFSNNVRPAFSAPTFEKAKFHIPETKSIDVRVAR